jgi:hypothetical protein
MKILTEDAVLVCKHDGHVRIAARKQDFVTVERRLVLVDNDPEGRPIVGCPMSGPGIKPCTNTLKVMRGYSTFVRIGRHTMCLDTVKGLTDGTPPGTVEYQVRNPGQRLVSSQA